ncbi:MAG: lipoate--protein ligase family protein, partial [Leptolyngbya sp. SIO3F4]|nr:lipoate--protein ligase family protein [Leptolyngbya sp. SIO3F4]
YIGSDKRDYQRSANCFGTSTTADLIMDNGYKLIGNAQLYRDRCILQHGSMRLAPDPDLVETVFGTPVTPPQALLKIKPTVVAASLTVAAQQIFDMSWLHQPLSANEQQKILTWVQHTQKSRKLY